VDVERLISTKLMVAMHLLLSVQDVKAMFECNAVMWDVSLLFLGNLYNSIIQIKCKIARTAHSMCSAYISEHS
jgi:hypothetical protein